MQSVLPQSAGVMPVLGSTAAGQNGDFAFHKHFYDKSCYRHAFKTRGLQLENGSNCVRDFNCSKSNRGDHRIKFLVLVFKRTLLLRSDKLLSKSF